MKNGYDDKRPAGPRDTSQGGCHAAHDGGWKMTSETIATLQTRLLRIEQQDDLCDDRNFVERAKTLDILERQILERIENRMYVHGYRGDLADLYRRAAYLRQRLQDVNHNLFGQLGEALAASAAPAEALYGFCETYVGRAIYTTRRPGCDEGYLDAFVNGIMGIGQTPEETVSLQSGMIGYIPTPACAIFALLEHAQLNTHDVFYDLGSGLGRVALLVGLLTPAQARGIEIEPAFCAYAQQRAQTLRLPHVTFINCDVRETDYADGTLFFMYTPFTGRMLQDVLAQLRQTASRRVIRVAAYGPCTPHIAAQSWLQATVCQTFEHDTLGIFTSQV
jgi:SAM-dependent methyltransferase